MNELCDIFLSAQNGSVITLHKDQIYHIYQDSCIELEGFYCSNTARKNENPTGLRRTALFLQNKKNITINGNGATILLHGKITPFLFDRCENICVNNLTIDYARPTMNEFTVLSNENGVCMLKINKDCLYQIKKNELIWLGETSKNGKPYWKHYCNENKQHVKLLDPETGLFTDYNRNNLVFDKIEEIGENIICATLKDKSVYLPKGAVIQTRSIVRDQTGGLFQRCKNLHFENLRIKFMHGLGMVCQFCDNITYLNCDFTPNEHRTAASTADFLQFSGCKGQITIDGIKARGAHDDFINVHGTHLRIIKQNKKKKSITVRFMHHESWGFQAFEVGDKIDFIRWDTLIPYNSAKVTAYERLNDTDIRLFLDKEIPSTVALKKDVVENATYTPDLHILNCSFGLTCGRGILSTTRGKVIIENNVFDKVWGPALLIEDDCNFWFESGYTTEIIFRNNKVHCCDYRKMYPGSPVIRYSPKVMNESSKEFVHGKLLIEGNEFSKPAEKTHLIHLEYLKEAIIKNNTFHEPYEITQRVVGNVVNEGNKLI